MGEGELVTLYEVTVRVGKQELAGARRRYRDFHKLHATLIEHYPHLLHPCVNHSPPAKGAGGMTPLLTSGKHLHDSLPPFPRKHLFRAGWDPLVVVERVSKLNAWLSAVCEKLQFASLELVSFLNVPLYAAIRLLSGDLQVHSHNQPARPPSPPCPNTRLLSQLSRQKKRFISPPSTPRPF